MTNQAKCNAYVDEIVADNKFCDGGQFGDGGRIPKNKRNWNASYPEVGREGMFDGGDVRVTKRSGGKVNYSLLNSEGKLTKAKAGTASLSDFRNAFAPWETKETDYSGSI